MEIRKGSGDDCPEQSFKALEEALKTALPKSFIYIFTDAGGKGDTVARIKFIQDKLQETSDSVSHIQFILIMTLSEKAVFFSCFKDKFFMSSKS